MNSNVCMYMALARGVYSKRHCHVVFAEVNDNLFELTPDV